MFRRQEKFSAEENEEKNENTLDEKLEEKSEEEINETVEEKKESEIETAKSGYERLKKIKGEALTTYFTIHRDDRISDEVMRASQFDYKTIEQFISDNKDKLSLESINLLEISAEESKAKNSYFKLMSEKK